MGLACAVRAILHNGVAFLSITLVIYSNETEREAKGSEGYIGARR